MTGGLLCEEIKSQLQAAFPAVYVGLPQDDGRVTLPAIRLQLQSDVVVGSPLERGHLTVMAESQADDTTPTDHEFFARNVDSFMRGISINTTGVTLAGIVAENNSEDHQDRHWKTILNYIIGFFPTS